MILSRWEESRSRSNTFIFRIKLKSETLQKNVFLFSEKKGTWQDNFFDILPGVSKYIQFKTDAKVVSKINFKTLNQFIRN